MFTHDLYNVTRFNSSMSTRRKRRLANSYGTLERKPLFWLRHLQASASLLFIFLLFIFFIGLRIGGVISSRSSPLALLSRSFVSLEQVGEFPGQVAFSFCVYMIVPSGWEGNPW